MAVYRRVANICLETKEQSGFKHIEELVLGRSLRNLENRPLLELLEYAVARGDDFQSLRPRFPTWFSVPSFIQLP
jgi:hypothetical protein